MDAQPYDPGRKRSVWFSPLLLAVALSPVFLQTSTPLSCKSGDTTLSELAVTVSGQNQITFVKTQRTYDVWLPLSATTALVRAIPTDPKAQIWVDVYVGGNRNRIMNGVVGGGEVTIPLQPDLNTLQVWVRPPGGASGTYNVAIRVGCSQCADGNVCTADTCDPVLRVCLNTPVPDGAGCELDGTAGTCMSGACDPSVFACTEQGIRDAIARGGGPYRFACNGPTTVATQDEIFIDNDVILDGEGKLTVQVNIVGGPGYRVFSVLADVTAELVGITIRGGAEIEGDGFDGGAIFSAGTLTLRNSNVVDTGMYPNNKYVNSGGGGIFSTGVLILQGSNVEGNEYLEHYGGGIYSTGTALIENSVIANNGSMGGCGGGIYNAGELTVLNSKIEENISSWAGGICNRGGTLTVRNSTLSGNFGDGDSYSGNTIYSVGIATFESSTVSNNAGEGAAEMSFHGSTSMVNTSVSGNRMGINGSGTMTLNSSTIVVATDRGDFDDQIEFNGELHVRNSIIVDSNPGDVIGACAFPIISEGYNIESNGNSCGFTHPTDLVNVSAEDLKLGPLADNGGPTMTHALLPGSVAIDRIPEAMCLDDQGQPLTRDQRGVARPQGGVCDVGAFEWADCSGTACDDGNDCTADHCDPASYAWCAQTTLPDGSFCGTDGVCEAGACGERSWGTAQLIETYMGEANRPQVTVDSNGNVTAVWIQYGVSASSVWSNRYTPSSGWGTPVLIEANMSWVDPAQVTADSNGNVTAVWVQEDDDGRNNVWSNRYTPSSGWGTAVLIETDMGEAGFPQVTVDSNGNVTAVWYQHDGVRYNIWSNRYTPSSGWGTPVLIETDMGSAEWPRVTVDSNGNVTAVWVQQDGVRYNIWSNRYTPSSGWGTPVLIETDMGQAGGPQVAVDSNGNVTAVWYQHDGVRYNIWSNRYE